MQYKIFIKFVRIVFKMFQFDNLMSNTSHYNYLNNYIV